MPPYSQLLVILPTIHPTTTPGPAKNIKSSNIYNQDPYKPSRLIIPGSSLSTDRYKQHKRIMSPPYTQLPIITSMEQLRKSCINVLDTQRCRRKGLCTKNDVWKAEHAALLREFVLSWNTLSQVDRTTKTQRFAELSVCNKCVDKIEEIGKVIEEQMQAFMEILFPDGVEAMNKVGDDDGMGMVGGDDGEEDGRDGDGDEQPGNQEQTAGTGVNQPVTNTSTKPQEPTTSGALDDIAIQDQATDTRNKKSTKSMLLKALVLALVLWVLVSNWMLSPVVVDEILCSWLNNC